MPGVADGPPEKQPASADWTPNQDEQTDLDAIDATLKQLRAHIPLDPYVLTIPQDVEPRYHHHYESHAKQWLSNTPFHEGEHEATQYLTYHYVEPEKDIYMLHNSRPIKETASAIAGEKTRPGPATNPSNGAIKKKISLSTYKKMQTSDVTTPERDMAKSSDAQAKQAAVKGPVERVKAETQEMLAAVAEDEEDDQKLKKEKSPEQGDLKRKRAAQKDQPDAKSQVDSLEPERSPKRLKTEKDRAAQKRLPNSAPQQRRGGPVGDKDTDDHESVEEFGLPPRLSPGLPPRMSPPLPTKLSPLHKPLARKSPKPVETKEGFDDAERSLPPRLSPTLPANITRTLRVRSESRSSSHSIKLAPNSILQEKNGKLTPVRKVEGGVTKPRSPNGGRASPSNLSTRVDREKQSSSAPGQSSLESSHEDGARPGRSANKKPVAVKDSKPPEVDSLIVKFKYKRARRDDIARILKMRPRSDKSMMQSATRPEEPKPPPKPAEKRNGERREDSQKGVAQRLGPVKKDKKPVEQNPTEKDIKRTSIERTPAPEKRKLPEDSKPEPAALRKRADQADGRKEPSTPASRDLDSPSVPKSQHATPASRKDLLSQTMKRDSSQDSNTIHTPSGLSSTPSVTHSSQINNIQRPPSSQPSNKTPRQQAWEIEQRRLEALGRELKHAATAHLNTGHSEHDQKLAAIKTVESFLCYLLAFTCADEAAAAADPKQPPSYRNWRSLHGFYGFVRRTTDAFAPLAGLANSLGVVFCARIVEITASAPVDGPSREILLETQVALHKAALAADDKLDVDALQAAFPRTWRERGRKLPVHDRPDPAKLAGPFKLPLGVATSPLRAARAGHAMLQEWTEREKMAYDLKLQLIG